jgi:hypothetical protein
LLPSLCLGFADGVWAAPGSGIAGCDSVVTSGTASSAVIATESSGCTEVQFPTPLYAKPTGLSTIIPCKGEPISAGQPVILDVTILKRRKRDFTRKTSYNATGGNLITVGKSTFPAVTPGSNAHRWDPASRSSDRRKIASHRRCGMPPTASGRTTPSSMSRG